MRINIIEKLILSEAYRMNIGDADVCMLSMTLMDVVERLLIDGGIIESDCCCSLDGNNSFAVQHLQWTHILHINH